MFAALLRRYSECPLAGGNPEVQAAAGTRLELSLHTAHRADRRRCRSGWPAANLSFPPGRPRFWGLTNLGCSLRN